jgi:L-lysine 6-transaminase
MIQMFQNSYSPRFAVHPTDVLRSLREHVLVDGFDHVVDLQRSHGAYFVEGRTGKQYLDFFTCIASMPIGMNHPKMTSPEFVQYLGNVALNKPSNSDIYNVEYATFAKTFFELAVPKHFTYAFFIDGGTLAVENAMKVAMDWKVRKNTAKGLPDTVGTQVLHFTNAFHGRSGYCLSVTNTDPTKTALFPKFDWPRVSTPVQEFPETETSLQRLIAQEQESIREIQQCFADRPNEICAIIVEPIQGEGGDNHFRPQFLEMLRTLADENDALLIFDEVQTGVGITGAMWAHEALGVVPDIMTFGKKMQVCGILVGSRVDEVPDNVFHTSSRINSTWGGSLVDMVRATRYLEIIAEDNLVANAHTMGEILHTGLQHVQAEHPDAKMSNVRGRGLFRSFDLPTTEIRNEFLKKAYANGLLLVGSGSRSIRFRPPLTVTPAHISEGLGIIAASLA